MATACAGAEEPYDEDWGSDALPSGKADGLLDGAKRLQFGEVGSGFVDGDHLEIFVIDLSVTDKITATMTVTSGDLSPHFTLFFGIDHHVRSKTFARVGKKLTKTYEIANSGRHFIGVRAFKNQGEGRYQFKIECDDGACAGDPIPVDLDVNERAECITQARRCAFAELPKFGGAVGPARARATFEACMARGKTDIENEACDTTCTVDSETQGLCDSIIGALPFYADVSGACLAELDSCMADCHRLAGFGDADDLFETAESLCWETGFNGTCDGYARGHTDCGGTEYSDDTNEQCHALCQSTSGAVTDDLDTICSDECD
jgi:hypothetical protein